MIVNETIRLRRPVTLDHIEGVSNPTVSIIQPDGSAYPSVPIVRVEPTDGQNVTLTYLITPTQGGVHQATLKYQDTDGETISLVDTYFATWTTLMAIARNRLQDVAEGVSDMFFEPEIASCARTILGAFPLIGNQIGTLAIVGNYGTLTGSDRLEFDEAVALTVCARTIGPLSTGGSVSDMTLMKVGDTEYRFAETARDRNDADKSPGSPGAGPGGYSGQNERVRWYKEAAACISRISTVKQARSIRNASFSPFAVAGPTRANIAKGIIPTLMTSLVELFTDDPDAFSNEPTI